MSFEDVVRIFLGCYFTFVAIAYTAKLLAVRHRTGESAVAHSAPHSLQYITHGLFGVFRAAIWAVCVLRIFFPLLDHKLQIISFLWLPEIMAVGCTLMLLSLFGIIYVHTFMGEVWRSGVDQNRSAQMLITHGPYRFTRNPIFMMIAVAQFGFFLSMPTIFSLICLIVGIAVLWAQVRIEETSLLRSFGTAYRDYTGHTPRWLFFVSHQ